MQPERGQVSHRHLQSHTGRKTGHSLSVTGQRTGVTAGDQGCGRSDPDALGSWEPAAHVLPGGQSW